MLETGQHLAHYRLLGKLGQGGMGVVWKAVDTKLDREVAIKMLPEQFANDHERLGRFQREAKLLASLNHRNIASIYGLDEADGAHFLVMELVDGEDLAERLMRGALPVDETLDIGHQLARAMENAHDKGILHRDLKPANVRITHEGRVKVLDFGLAKAFDTEPQTEGDPTASPTLTSLETRTGVILGTATYMSPEQARGKPLDKRTDIWAFGCLLYECLTGKSAFHGETVTDTLASIVKTPADWSLLPEDTPPRVRELLARCLEKDARNRLRDIGEARIELQRAIGTTDSMSDSNLDLAPPAAEPARRSSPVWLAVAALVGAVAGIGLWSALTGGAADPAGGENDVLRLSVAFPSDLDGGSWDLSPDGRTIAFAGTPKSVTGTDAEPIRRLYLRPLNSGEPMLVEDSEDVSGFTFSPDGQSVAFRAPVAPRSRKHRLMRVPVDGSSPPLVLSDWRDEWNVGLLWLPDGDIVVQTTTASLVRIPAAGGSPGDPVEVRPNGYEGGVRLPTNVAAVLPDGVHVLTAVTTYTDRGYDDHVGLLNLNTGDSRILIENGSSAALTRSGQLVFSRGDTVLATAFDASRMEPVGNIVAIEAGFRAVAGYGDTFFSLSADGTMLHWPGGIYGDERQLAFVEHDATSGYRLGEIWSDEKRFFEGGFRVSPDGRRLAVGIANDSGLYETWISEVDRPRLVRFAHEPGRDCTPHTWSDDGRRLIYSCGTTDGADFFVRSVDEDADPRLLFATSFPEYYTVESFLPDGSTLVLSHWVDMKGSLARLSLDTDDAAPVTWLEDAFGARVSPDGRWLSYASDVSGRNEAYVRPLGADGTLGGEIPVSTSGGGTPYWNSATQLTFHDGDEMYVADIGPGQRVSAPRSVGSPTRILQRTVEHQHLADGRMMVVLQDEGEARPGHVNVVLHWTDQLAERLGAQ